MKPRRFSYTLAALNATGFATGLTGAGPVTTFNAQTDGTAHQTTLVSAANLSGITLTIVGTDAQGNVLTEVTTGPNATTKNLTNYFKSITSITASGTLGANTMNVGWTALCQTPFFPVDHAKLTGPVFSVGVGGTITFTAQQSVSPIFDSSITPVWQTLGTVSATANAITQALAGTTAVRCTVASHTSGVLTLDISQARQ